jgi:hypothetical protein
MQESSSSDRFSRRKIIACLVFVSCCLLSSARMLRDAARPSHIQPSANERRTEQRFSALKAALPERGVIGYVGEPGADAMGDYYWAQYALAPLVVEHSPNHRLVVGNFVSTSAARPAFENLHLARDFGNGVLLFSNEDAR